MPPSLLLIFGACIALAIYFRCADSQSCLSQDAYNQGGLIPHHPPSVWYYERLWWVLLSQKLRGEGVDVVREAKRGGSLRWWDLIMGGRIYDLYHIQEKLTILGEFQMLIQTVIG